MIINFTYARPVYNCIEIMTLTLILRYIDRNDRLVGHPWYRIPILGIPLYKYFWVCIHIPMLVNVRGILFILWFIQWIGRIMQYSTLLFINIMPLNCGCVNINLTKRTKMAFQSVDNRIVSIRDILINIASITRIIQLFVLLLFL